MKLYSQIVHKLKIEDLWLFRHSMAIVQSRANEIQNSPLILSTNAKTTGFTEDYKVQIIYN